MGKKRASKVAEEVVAVIETVDEPPVKAKRPAFVGNPVTHPDAWISVKDAAAALGLTSQTVWRLSNEGHIRRWLMGTRKAKYYQPDCMDFLARNNLQD